MPTGKLTLISIIIKGIRYSAFAFLNDGKTIPYSELCEIFPKLNAIPYGTTFTIG